MTEEPEMRRTLSPTALFVAVIATVGLVASNRASPAQALHVVSSDATAHFMVLGMARSAVIDVSTDIKNVVVADPKIVGVTVLSRRRVSIIGHGHGETNLFFFDADGRPIDSLDVAVTGSALQNGSSPAVFEYDDALPAIKVVIFRNSASQLLTCTPSTCISTLTEEEEKEAKTSREVCEGCGSSITQTNK